MARDDDRTDEVTGEIVDLSGLELAALDEIPDNALNSMLQRALTTLDESETYSGFIRDGAY